MNGQTTAQNTHECGCSGEFLAFHNGQNPAHIHQLAQVWNVEPSVIPSWHEPAHAMEIFRHAETGLVKMLWIIATNPAISMPELHRIRKILSQGKLFDMVQDAFMAETAKLADVVLPTAIWGEKTGSFTNTDRAVHISYKTVEPPGKARPDMDILLDYAIRMDFRDKDGAPLLKWSTLEEAFEAWKECSRGHVCDAISKAALFSKPPITTRPKKCQMISTRSGSRSDAHKRGTTPRRMRSYNFMKPTPSGWELVKAKWSKLLHAGAAFRLQPKSAASNPDRLLFRFTIFLLFRLKESSVRLYEREPDKTRKR